MNQNNTDKLLSFLDLNFFSLSYKSNFAKYEKGFISYFLTTSLSMSIFTLILSATLYLLFGILDYVVFPTNYSYFWFIRLIVGTLIIVLASLMKYNLIDYKYHQVVLFFLMHISGAGIIIMNLIGTNNFIHFYFAGFMLVLFTGFSFIRLRFPLAFLTAILNFILLQYVIIFVNQYSPQIIILCNFFVGSAFLLSVYVGYSLEVLRRKEYVMQMLLEEQQTDIVSSNENLEHQVEVRTKELQLANAKLSNEIIERFKLETAEKKHKKNIYYLAKSAINFLETSLEEDLYSTICETISKFSDNKIVIVSQIDQIKEELNLKSISGLGKLQTKILGMLNYNFFDKPQPIPVELVNIYKEGKICQVEVSLYEFLLCKIPQSVCKSLQSILNISKIYSIGFMWNNVLYGNATILLKKHNNLDNKELIEAYSVQASIALQRHFAEIKVIENEKWYKKILQEQGEGVAISDFNEKITFCNPMAEKLFNVEENTLVGRNLTEFILEDDLALVSEETEKRKHGKSSKFEIRIKNNDNSFKYILVTATPINKNGNINSGLAIFRDITDRKNKDKKIKKSLEENQILLKEVHHRVKNNMQIISSLLRMQTRSSTNPDIINSLLTSQNRVQSMAIIHERLYQSNDFTSVDFDNYATQLAEQLTITYNNSDVKIINDIERINLDINLAVPCGLILNEIISNSLKYAFPEGRKGQIKISFKLINNEYQFKVSDNGIGLPENFSTKGISSLGMQIIKTLTKQLHGKLETISDNGLTYLLTFEKPNLRSFNFKKLPPV